MCHTFRARVWRPSLVHAGLLGSVAPGGDGFLGTWTSKAGAEQSKRYLRHCYATWLVSSGVPINDVAGLIGHEQISTTPNRYTHASRDRNSRARAAFADFSLTPAPDPHFKPDTERDRTKDTG